MHDQWFITHWFTLHLVQHPLDCCTHATRSLPSLPLGLASCLTFADLLVRVPHRLPLCFLSFALLHCIHVMQLFLLVPLGIPLSVLLIEGVIKHLYAVLILFDRMVFRIMCGFQTNLDPSLDLSFDALPRRSGPLRCPNAAFISEAAATAVCRAVALFDRTSWAHLMPAAIPNRLT